MKRDLYQKLLAWKLNPRRKPLLLQGARQTGKTYILKAFGRNEYENLMYCNFEEDPGLDQFFKRDLAPDRIIKELSIYFDMEIRPGLDLMVFDEIQVSNRALNSLKYFEEKRKDIHIAAAGSLLGVKLSSPGSFPVGKVNFLHLFPMSFMEFLDGIGEDRYRQLIEEVSEPIPLSETFHSHLVDLLRQYYFIGGMPEAVNHFAIRANVREVREIHQEIIKSYIMDFAKHAPASDIPKLTQLWDSIPKHLARENKKFIYSAVKKSARAREYENALTWLEDAGLIYRATATRVAKSPLSHYADKACFKIYALDVGLLGTMSRTPVDLLSQGDRLFNEYDGSLVESFTSQQLAAHFEQPLYYWRSKGGKAELDFLCEFSGRIYPLEVKAGINPRSKSLRSYDMQFSPSILARATLLNLKKDGKILNLPLYAISRFFDMVETTMEYDVL
jgi:predicted AAA+ superfamily ATPase